MTLLKTRISVLEAFSKTSAAHAQEAETDIFDMSNSVKAIEGMLKGLENPHMMDTKRAAEEAFKAAVMANPEWKAKYGSAWDEIAEAERESASALKIASFTARILGWPPSQRIS